jgi:hypothetical protein
MAVLPQRFSAMEERLGGIESIMLDLRKQGKAQDLALKGVAMGQTLIADSVSETATKFGKLLDVPRMKRDVSPGRNASPRPASKKPKAAFMGSTLKEDAIMRVSDLCAKYGRSSICS